MFPDELKTEAMCLAAVQNPASEYTSRGTPSRNKNTPLQYVPDWLRTEALCLTAVQHDRKAFDHVPEEMKARVEAAVKK